MSFEDETSTQLGNLSVEQKLAILFSELKQRMSLAGGYAGLILELVRERKPQEMPDDFVNWCEIVANSIEESQEMIHELFLGQSRESFEQGNAVRQRELDQEIWMRMQAAVSELRDFESLADAVAQAARRLGLPLDSSSVDSTRSAAIYPMSGSAYFSTSERQATIGMQASPRHQGYLGYIVTLSWLADARNLIWHEHASLTQSLDEATLVVNEWLVENQKLHRIREEYLWVANGVMHSIPHPTWLPEGLKHDHSGVSPLESAQISYIRADGESGELTIKVMQGVWARDTIFPNAAKQQVAAVKGYSAIYAYGDSNEQREWDETANGGVLEWSASGLIYNIRHSGLGLGLNDLIRIAESLS